MAKLLDELVIELARYGIMTADAALRHFTEGNPVASKFTAGGSSAYDVQVPCTECGTTWKVPAEKADTFLCPSCRDALANMCHTGLRRKPDWWAFTRAIAAAKLDDTLPRLVAADYLDEQGFHGLAFLMRNGKNPEVLHAVDRGRRDGKPFDPGFNRARMTNHKFGAVEPPWGPCERFAYDFPRSGELGEPLVFNGGLLTGGTYTPGQWLTSGRSIVRHPLAAIRAEHLTPAVGVGQWDGGEQSVDNNRSRLDMFPAWPAPGGDLDPGDRLIPGAYLIADHRGGPGFHHHGTVPPVIANHLAGGFRQRFPVSARYWYATRADALAALRAAYLAYAWAGDPERINADTAAAVSGGGREPDTDAWGRSLSGIEHAFRCLLAGQLEDFKTSFAFHVFQQGEHFDEDDTGPAAELVRAANRWYEARTATQWKGDMRPARVAALHDGYELLIAAAHANRPYAYRVMGEVAAALNTPEE